MEGRCFQGWRERLAISSKSRWVRRVEVEVGVKVEGVTTPQVGEVGVAWAEVHRRVGVWGRYEGVLQGVARWGVQGGAGSELQEGGGGGPGAGGGEEQGHLHHLQHLWEHLEQQKPRGCLGGQVGRWLLVGAMCKSSAGSSGECLLGCGGWGWREAGGWWGRWIPRAHIQANTSPSSTR